MNENLALLLAVLYLIYRFKTYRKTNKIIEDRIENVHKPYFKRVRDVLGCSEEEAEKVGLALDKYFVPLESKFYKIDDISLSLIAPRVACLATQLLQEEPINWQQMPFILPLDGMARQRIEQWLRSKHIKHPKIYATVAGHEGIVPMVALGFGLAMLPDVVIDNNPMSKDVSRLNLDNPIEAFDLGVCVQKRNLANPLIRAFWEMLD